MHLLEGLASHKTGFVTSRHILNRLKVGDRILRAFRGRPHLGLEGQMLDVAVFGLLAFRNDAGDNVVADSGTTRAGDLHEQVTVLVGIEAMVKQRRKG